MRSGCLGNNCLEIGWLDSQPLAWLALPAGVGTNYFPMEKARLLGEGMVEISGLSASWGD